MDILELAKKQLREFGATSIHLEKCPPALLSVAEGMGFSKTNSDGSLICAKGETREMNTRRFFPFGYMSSDS